MALIWAVETPDTGVIQFYPDITLAATESPDIGAGLAANIIAVEESPDVASIEIDIRSVTVEASESLDGGAIDILQGELIRLGPAETEAKDSASIVIYNGILTEIVAIEAPDQASLDILQGVIGELSATEALDIGLVAFSANTALILAAEESPDECTFFITEAPITYVRKAVVMHLFNYAISEYKNFNFNSLIQFNGITLGLNEDGIYILGGSDDLGVPIQAVIASGVEDLGKNGVITIPREAWLAYRSDSSVQLDVRVDEVTDLPSAIFSKVAPMITESREKLGRGIKGRFFTWVLKNVGGSDFSLESLRILGDLIRRKTR